MSQINQDNDSLKKTQVNKDNKPTFPSLRNLGQSTKKEHSIHSNLFLTRPSKAVIGKKHVFPRSNWIQKLLNDHPNVKNLRERLSPLSRAIAFSELYKGRTSVSHSDMLQLVLQYLDHEGYHGVVSILEKESKVSLKQCEIEDCRLITLINLFLKDVEDIYTNAMRNNRDEQFLHEILQSFGIMNDKLFEQNDINIWNEPTIGNIEYESDSDDIAFASLNKLIEYLTPSSGIHIKFVKVFLTTYSTFISSEFLLYKLKQRYFHPLYDKMDEQQILTEVVPVQLRIINFMKQWVIERPEEFNEKLISNMKEFITLFVLDVHKIQSSSVLSLLDNVNNDDDIKVEIPSMYNNKEPRPIVPRNIFSSNLSWEDIDDEELARQFTLIEYDIFRKIKTSELLNQSWNKPHLKHRAPHIIQSIKRFNEVSMWAGSVIVLASGIKHRVKIFTKLIYIADYLRKLNNYSTLMAFVAVFNNSSITRLTDTISELPPKANSILQELMYLMDNTDSFAEYKSKLEASKPPCIPYIGLYLTDLVFAEEINEVYVDGLINFKRCRSLHRIISKIKRYQYIGYDLQSVYQIQNILLNLNPILDESDMYQYSCQIQPSQ